MAVNQFDWYDTLLATLFAFTAAVSVGIAQVEVFNTAFSDQLFTIGGTGLTVASILGVSILAIVYLTNDNDVRNMDTFYQGAVLGTVGLTLAIPFIPAVQDVVTTNDIARVLTVGVMAVGYGAVAYIK